MKQQAIVRFNPSEVEVLIAIAEEHSENPKLLKKLLRAKRRIQYKEMVRGHVAVALATEESYLIWKYMNTGQLSAEIREIMRCSSEMTFIESKLRSVLSAAAIIPILRQS